MEVAPHVGAWIETYWILLYGFGSWVAPHVGAWIETKAGKRRITSKRKSHPTWVRGLKLAALYTFVILVLSHPTWVRGLKQGYTFRCARCQQSHPTWVRGLKHFFYNHECLKRVSHPTWVRGLKLKPESKVPYKGAGRTPRGCVD